MLIDIQDDQTRRENAMIAAGAEMHVADEFAAQIMLYRDLDPEQRELAMRIERGEFG